MGRSLDPPSTQGTREFLGWGAGEYPDLNARPSDQNCRSFLRMRFGWMKGVY